MRNLSTKKHSGLGVKRGGVKTTNCVHHDSGYTLTTLTCNTGPASCNFPCHGVRELLKERLVRAVQLTP